MSDPLPTGLTYAGGLDCTTGSLVPTTCVATGNTVSATWASFAVGDITVITFQATVNGDVNPGPITNTATVTDATTLPGDDPNERDEPDAEDDDDVLVVNPSIDIQKTVYRTHDSGQSCAGEELQYGENGDVVTYCFVVTNTGDTYLDSIELSDPLLGGGITTADMTLLSAPGTFPPLAPTESITYYYQTTIDGDLLNTVSVTANPTDDMGGDLPGVGDVDDDDTAEVIEIAPAINLEKTVYAGHDNGAGCEGGELAIGVTTAPVTYCFVVTNTGDTVLSNVVIEDSDLGITTTQMTFLSASSTYPPLGIGETITYFYTTTITADLLNTATVTGTPSDGAGDPLPGADDVTDTDTAAVDLLTPAIEIEKTVYAGHDAGVTVEGSELVEAINGSAVTYCFVVTNSGETYLDSIVITDTLLGIDQSDMTLIAAQSDPLPLAPLGILVYYFETTLDGALTNTAETEGNPTDSSGTDLPNGVNPTDDDTAAVAPLVPAIDLQKTVYENHDAGASCATGGELVSATADTAITYCFTVTNTGDTYLDDIEITDSTLGITHANVVTQTTLSDLPLPLAPGGTVVFYFETTLTATLTNTASVAANPTLADGTDSGDDDVTDSDTAAVELSTAIELASFDAYRQPDGSVRLTWTTATEIDNAGFNIYRSASATFDATSAIQINSSLIAAQAEFGQGAAYELLDEGVAGTWFYFLEDVDLNGLTSIHGPVSADSSVPTSAGLTSLQGLDTSATLVVFTLLVSVLALVAVVWRRRLH